MSGEINLVDALITFGGNYLFIVIGIMISFILPILRKAVPQVTNTTFRGRFRDEAKPYLTILAFSLVAGFLTLATLAEVFDWKTALLTGYAWDSTLQKIAG